MMNTKKQLSKSDVAFLSGVSTSTLNYWLKTGVIRPPATGKRFTLEETREVLNAICREGTELSCAQTAERLGISYHVFQALRRNGEIPKGKPKGRRYYYALADLDKLKEMAEKARAARPNGNYQHAALLEGWYNGVQAARYCRVPEITFRVHLARGNIPKPTHPRGSYRYYTLDEVRKLAEWFGGQQKPPKREPLKF